MDREKLRELSSQERLVEVYDEGQECVDTQSNSCKSQNE